MRVWRRRPRGATFICTLLPAAAAALLLLLLLLLEQRREEWRARRKGRRDSDIIRFPAEERCSLVRQRRVASDSFRTTKSEASGCYTNCACSTQLFTVSSLYMCRCCRCRKRERLVDSPQAQTPYHPRQRDRRERRKRNEEKREEEEKKKIARLSIRQLMLVSWWLAMRWSSSRRHLNNNRRKQQRRRRPTREKRRSRRRRLDEGATLQKRRDGGSALFFFFLFFFPFHDSIKDERRRRDTHKRAEILISRDERRLKEGFSSLSLRWSKGEAKKKKLDLN